VLINIFGINNDPNVWPNPEKWDPERVLNNESLDMGIKNLSIMPFGAGKRMCAGITQVLNFMLPYLSHSGLKIQKTCHIREERMSHIARVQKLDASLHQRIQNQRHAIGEY
jgi:hypothetical protein